MMTCGVYNNLWSSRQPAEFTMTCKITDNMQSLQQTPVEFTKTCKVHDDQ